TFRCARYETYTRAMIGITASCGYNCGTISNGNLAGDERKREWVLAERGIDFGSSGESVGNWRVSTLGSSEESVEFAAGGIEGALLVFPAIVNEPTAVLVDHINDELFGGDIPQSRLLVPVANDLSAEQHHIVDAI